MRRERKVLGIFLNLEKRNKNYNVIRCIKSDDDVLVTSRKSILHELKMFYKALYTSENTNPDHYFDGFAPEKRLSEEVSQECDGLLTIEECLIALNSMSLNKSPGCDGLTVNFYKHFWYLIGQLVVDALNNAYHKGELSPEQRRGIITLIPKPGKDPKLMKNLRPITLLNTDYKIGAKCLANRIKVVLPSIVGFNQTGFMKGRFIGENIRFTLDLIEYCKESAKPGLIFLVDFEKAFDRLEWSFVFKSLQKFKFGNCFIQWVKTLYRNGNSCVCNNGYSSGNFMLNRGVRQGCPLSPYLFILCVEVLAQKIWQTS